MKLLSLIKNEFYKELAKKTFLVFLSITIIISVSVPIFTEFKHKYEYNDINTYNRIHDGTENLYSRININSELNEQYDYEEFKEYKEEYYYLKNILDDIIKKYRSYKNYDFAIKSNFVEASVLYEFRIKYVEYLKEHENVRNNRFVYNDFVSNLTFDEKASLVESGNNYIENNPQRFNEYDIEKLELICESYKPKLEEYKKIIVDEDYTQISKLYINTYKKKIDFTKEEIKSLEEHKDTNPYYEQHMERKQTELKQYEYMLDTVEELSKKEIKGNNKVYIFDYLEKIEEINQNYSQSLNIIPIEKYVGVDYDEYVRIKKSEQRYYKGELEKYRYAIFNEIEYQKSGIRNLFNNTINASIITFVFSLMIACSIISDEFNKGTIRSVLTKPCSRTKVLLSKVLTMVIFTIFYLTIFVILGFITSMILLGVKDLSISMLDIIGNKVVEISFITYILKRVGLLLASMLTINMIGLTLSNLILHTQGSTITTLILYLSSIMLVVFGAVSKLYRFLVYTTIPYHFMHLYENYDLLSSAEKYIMHDITYKQGLTTLLIYVTLCLIVSFIVFNKRDVKN